jgi:hypothetical protein
MLLALEDAAGGQGEADGCYRLAQCAVHESGALLLELRDGEAYDRQLRSRVPRVAAAVAAAAAAAAGTGFPAAGGDAFVAGDAGEAGFGGPDAGEFDYDDDDGGGWDGGSDGGSDGGAIDLGDGLGASWGGDAAPMEEGAPQDDGAWAADAGADAVPGEPDAAPAGGVTAARQRRAGAGGDSVAKRAGGRGEPFDPYKPLDPNDRGSLLVKPLQVRGGLGRGRGVGGIGGCCWACDAAAVSPARLLPFRPRWLWPVLDPSPAPTTRSASRGAARCRAATTRPRPARP